MSKILFESTPENIQGLDSVAFKSSIEQLATLVNQISIDEAGSFELDEVILSVKLSDQGEVILLNSTQGAITLKFKRSHSPKIPQLSYKKLENLLINGRWQEANQETWHLLCGALHKNMGTPLTGADIEQIPCGVLNNIDKLWHHHSKGKYGFTVQNRIYKDSQIQGK